MKNFLLIVTVLLAAKTGTLHAQTLEEKAEAKIDSLKELIKIAEEDSFDVIREEMTLNTAELFLDYAKWDEANIATNKSYYEVHPYYKNEAQQKANALPDFERASVIQILDASINELNRIISGEIIRQPAVNPSWSKMTVEDDKIVYNDKPIFVADYTWKPNVRTLTNYYGASSTAGLRPSFIQDDQGKHETNYYNDYSWLNESGKIGSVWFSQNDCPNWIKQKYPDIQTGARHYGKWDIDHAGSKEMCDLLFETYVPKLAGKNVTKLGYQLWNEPSFFTKKGSWNSLDDNGVCVSDSTLKKFKIWLSNKHDSIQALNSLYKTNYNSFSEVQISLPIDGTLQGQPIWYDWCTFNDYRVTDFFKYMKAGIRKYDPNAKVHIKIMPWNFSSNSHDHGMDFEALTELSDIIGCDAGTQYLHAWSSTSAWDTRYKCYWRDAIMTFDFFKSVSPNKFIYDTENHFLMNTGFTEQDLNQDYVNAMYWLAVAHGLTSTSTWVWTRDGNGAMTREKGASNMVDVSHQPKTLNTITRTFMDMNGYSDELYKMQREKKSIRIFYSKHCAHNDNNYMDKVFASYESVFFEGLSIGFATENILNKDDNFDVLIVNNTEYATLGERDAIQAYLNKGGKIILSSNSLKKDEYGRTLDALNDSIGSIFVLNDLTQIKDKAYSLSQEAGSTSEISIDETNTVGKKGVVWQVVKNKSGNNVLLAINLGKSDAKLNIELNGAKNGTRCFNLLTGVQANNKPTLKPYAVYFVEIKDEVPTSINKVQATNAQQNLATLYPNPSTGMLFVDLKQWYPSVELTVFSMQGQTLFTKTYAGADKVVENLKQINNGEYIIQLKLGDRVQTSKFVKR